MRTVGITCPKCKQINCYNFPKGIFLVKNLPAKILKCTFCSYTGTVNDWSLYNDTKKFILHPRDFN